MSISRKVDQNLGGSTWQNTFILNFKCFKLLLEDTEKGIKIILSLKWNMKNYRKKKVLRNLKYKK